jgi:Amt family ammonium transporter
MGAITAALLTQFVYKKVDLTMVLNGALGGLVAVTAGPDNGMIAASIEGIVAAVLVMIAVPFFDKLKLDDPVGALSVHLVNGIWGTIAVAIFNPQVTLGTQLTGIVVIGAFTFITSYIVWYVIKLVMGLRISEEEEYDGEDIHAIGVEAYPEFVKNLK